MALPLENFTEFRIGDKPVGLMEAAVHTPAHPSNDVINTVIGEKVIPHFIKNYTEANCKTEVTFAKEKGTIEALEYYCASNKFFEYTLVSKSDSNTRTIKEAFIVGKPEYDATSIKVTFTGIEA